MRMVPDVVHTCANRVLWFGMPRLAESENSMRIKHNLGAKNEILKAIFLKLPKLAILRKKHVVAVIYL